MYLLKCSCGCHFTIKSIARKNHYTCQNCDNKFLFDRGEYYESTLKTIKDAGFEMLVLPDDAKMSTSFDT